MKLLTSILLVLFFIQNSISQNIIIKDVNLITITSHSVTQKQSVLIQNNKITQIGDFNKLPNNKRTTIIDGSDKYLMPALSDMHVHLPKENELEQFYKMNIAAGVTHIRVMNSSIPQPELIQLINNNIEIPTLHFSQLIRRDLQKYSEQQFDSIILTIKKNDIEFIKLFSLSDEKTFENLMKSANKNNITVCGHYPKFAQFGKWQYMDIKKTLTSGYKSIEHLGGYIQIKAEEELKEAIQLTKENNVYNCPTIDWAIMAYDIQYPSDYKNRLTYKTLPKDMIDKWELKYEQDIENAGGKEKVLASTITKLPKFKQYQKILKLLAEEDCPLLIGGDAGNTFQADGFNVHEEMKNWSDIGIDNYTILKSATIIPAAFFNQENERGTIEIGKDADLILLDKNPLENIENISTITTTIMKGQVYYKSDLLPLK